MPKSRRDKPISLTKTKKHGRASKERLVEDIRECLSTYSSVYVFEVENMRNVKFKELREEWGGSRFFMGKNRVMQMALGRDPHDEHKAGISKLTPVSPSPLTAAVCIRPARRRARCRTTLSRHVGCFYFCCTALLVISMSLVNAVFCSPTPARGMC